MEQGVNLLNLVVNIHVYVSPALIRSNSTFSTYEFCTVLIVSSYYFLKQLYQVYL
jgi:hypothetical protein